MFLLCPDNPLMNASRHAVELVGDELEQAEPAELLTLRKELPELLLEELPDLAEALPELLEELLELTPELPILPVVVARMAIVAELGVPKPATPVTVTLSNTAVLSVPLLWLETARPT